MKSISCFILFVISIAVHAQQADEIDQFITKQMIDQKITGLSIGIIVQGKIVKSKGYGSANLEHQIPATGQTVYKIGSVSKQMIAVGIMKLVQTGKIRLADPVTTYFKDAPATWSNITIRHLLNHTSGLVRESPAFQPMLVQHDTVLIKAVYKLPLVFATGTKWQYCNVGYFMLADIIRQVSGKPFAQYMQDEIFAGNGFVTLQTTSTTKIIPNRADGYMLYGKDSLIRAVEYVAFRPSGAFISAIPDLLKWEMMMQEGRLLSKENWQQMWTDTVTTDAANSKANYYGYGWMVGTFKNRTVVYHGGSVPGFRSTYYRFPADKTAFVILTNSDHANLTPVAEGIAEILYKD